jgi:hypothetical protein
LKYLLILTAWSTIALGGVAARASAQTTISTRSANEQLYGLSLDPLGGQSFVAPIGSPVLRTWEMAAALSEPGGQMRAGIWQFDPNAITLGLMVWQSAVLDAPVWGFRPTLDVPFTRFNVNVELEAGKNYFFGVAMTSPGSPDFRGMSSDISYAGGDFFYWPTSQPTSGQVGIRGLSSDLAFEAEFDAQTVPEPPSLLLVLAGLGGIATIGIGRKRTR